MASVIALPAAWSKRLQPEYVSLDQFLSECKQGNVDTVTVNVESDTIDEVGSQQYVHIVVAPVFCAYSGFREGEVVSQKALVQVGALCYDRQENPPQAPLERPEGILKGMAQPLEEILRDADRTAVYILQQGLPKVRVSIALIHGTRDTYEKIREELTFNERVELPPRWG